MTATTGRTCSPTGESASRQRAESAARSWFRYGETAGGCQPSDARDSSACSLKPLGCVRETTGDCEQAPPSLSDHVGDSRPADRLWRWLVVFAWPLGRLRGGRNLVEFVPCPRGRGFLCVQVLQPRGVRGASRGETTPWFVPSHNRATCCEPTGPFQTRGCGAAATR